MQALVEQARKEAIQQASDRKSSSIYRGDIFSLASEDSFYDVINLLPFTRRPEVALTAEGILQMIWRDGSGLALSLHLPGAEDPAYAVFGPGRKFGLPDVLERGSCPIEELPDLIAQHRLQELLGIEGGISGSGLSEVATSEEAST